MNRMDPEIHRRPGVLRRLQGTTAGLIGRCILVALLLGLASASGSLADEDVARLPMLSYEVGIDGQITAAWGVDGVSTEESAGLEEVMLLVPPDVAEYIEKVRSQQGGTLFDYVVIIPDADNSVRASRCHCHADGTCHCHST